MLSSGLQRPWRCTVALEDWVDTLADVFAVSDGKGGTVKSYHFYDRPEFPGSITVFPCAVTVPQRCRPMYSLGGPLVDYWQGITELHIAPNNDMSLIPYAVRFVKRVRDAAAANLTLGGRVAHFLIRQDIPDAIAGPVKIRWAEDEPWHWGLVVAWEVKDAESYTVSA